MKNLELEIVGENVFILSKDKLVALIIGQYQKIVSTMEV